MGARQETLFGDEFDDLYVDPFEQDGHISAAHTPHF